MRSLILAVSGPAFCLITACSSGNTAVEVVPKTPVASVTVTLPAVSLVAGQTQVAVATPRDANGAGLTDRQITWTSSATAVASVTESGMISALTPGTTTITAASEGVSGQAMLTVVAVPPIPVASVTVSPASPSIQVGATTQLSAVTRDANNNVLSGGVVTWSSDNSGIASVDANGLVSAVSAGGTRITASSEGKTGSVSLAVTAVPVASVTVSLANPTLTPGATTQATATLRDANNNVLTGRTLAWTSGNNAIATVSGSGLVTAVATGNTSITATSEGKTGSATVTVTAIPVATVTVTLANPAITAGATTQATATLRDANNNVLTGRTVAWTSGNNAIATVSSSGLVTGVAAGSTSITATSEGKTGTASVTVTVVPVASVTVSIASSAITAGATTQATATLRDANNNVLTGRTVTWVSGNTGVATVSGSGLVTGVAAGTTGITATSGGVSGSANVTVSAQSSNIVFSDDFESGTFSNWNESNSTVQQIINDPASAHSGNRFLRLTYGINGGDAAWLNKYFYQGFTQVYVRYYIRFSANFTGGTKMVGFHGAPIGNPTAGVGRAGICPNGSDSFAALVVNDFGDTYPTKMYTYWQDMWADSNGQCWGRYGPTPSTMWSPYISPMPTMSKGVWHKIEYAVKMNSGPNVADGEQRFWVDGVKYGEWTGIRFGDPTKINIGVLLISGSGSTAQIQNVDYDDLILTTDYPSQSQP